MKERFHQPVLLNEVIEHLNVKEGGKYLDTTVGGGGHAEAIIQRGGRLLGLDCDPEAVEFTKKRLNEVCPDAFWKVIRGNFTNLAAIAQEHGFTQVDGLLFDLGVSSHQLETPARGFSFLEEGPLDMRMGPDLKVTAADLVNGLSRKELNALFTKLGEEKRARTIADALVRTRRLKKIETTQQLAEIVVEVYGGRRKVHGRHPATKVFQALRIAVNDELNNLKEGLLQAEPSLKPGGRLVVISFHGLEDRLIKNFFREKSREGKLKIITKKPIRPSSKEIKNNPRSRSAKLRAAEKNG